VCDDGREGLTIYPCCPVQQGVKRSISKYEDKIKGLLFKPDAIAAGLAVEYPDTGCLDPNDLVCKSLKKNDTGPFIISTTTSTIDTILDKIPFIYVKPMGQFNEGKFQPITDHHKAIQFSTSKASPTDMAQVNPQSSNMGIKGAWIVLITSALAASRGNYALTAIRKALSKQGLEAKLKWSKTTLGQKSTKIHADVRAIPENFAWRATFNFKIEDDEFSVKICDISNEILSLYKLKKCCYLPDDNTCLCELGKRPRINKPRLFRSRDDAMLHYYEEARQAAAEARRDMASAGTITYFYIPIYSYTWNSTLGYEGEGPTSLKILSLNINGILTDNTWINLLTTTRHNKFTIISLQETNLAMNDPRLDRLNRDANKLSYKPNWSFRPSNTSRGGTCMLIDFELLQYVTNAISFGAGYGLCIDMSINSIALRIINVYAPANGKHRTNFFNNHLKKIVNMNSIICGDFNCVMSTTLDTKRSSTTPYDNQGSKELINILDNNLINDEIRLGLGLDFEYTKKSNSQLGYSLTRIDAIFTPSIPDVEWTMNIDHNSYCHLTDHSACSAYMKFTKQTNTSKQNKKALITLNENLIYDPDLNKDLINVIDIAKTNINKGTNPFKVYNALIKQVRLKWTKATKITQKKINKELKFLNLQLTQSTSKLKSFPSRKAIKQFRNIEQNISTIKNQYLPPGHNYARFAFRKEELMSREFFKDIIPSSKKNSKIEALKKDVDWSNPGPKEAQSNNNTEKVADEAANYYEHLAKPVNPDNQEQAKKMLDSQNILLEQL
jgi:exonuclease III